MLDFEIATAAGSATIRSAWIVVAGEDVLRVCNLLRALVNPMVGDIQLLGEALVPGVFEVEFSGNQGRTYAQLALPEHQLLVLHSSPSTLRNYAGARLPPCVIAPTRSAWI